jgi:GNAT superfamily N-acetyltransferase
MICIILAMNSFHGTYMRHDQVQELMDAMNTPKVAHVLREEDDSGDDDWVSFVSKGRPFVQRTVGMSQWDRDMSRSGESSPRGGDARFKIATTPLGRSFRRPDSSLEDVQCLVRARTQMPAAATISIARFEKQDLTAVRSLLSVFGAEQSSAEAISKRLTLISQHPDQSLWVAKANGHVRGFLGFRIRHNLEAASEYGEVSIIVVDECWRKKGVGQLLLNHAEALARKHGCIGLWLVSGFGRESEAHSFYERAGFSKTGFRFVKPLLG